LKCIEGYHKSLLVKVPVFLSANPNRPERCHSIRGDSLAREAVVEGYLVTQVKRKVMPIK